MSITETLIEAIQLQAQGRIDDAVQRFESVLAIDRVNAAALYSLGVIALGRSDIAKAFEWADRGVGAGLAFAPLHFLHGTALQKLGKNEAALASFDAAIALQADYVEPLVNSGVLLRAMFRHKESLDRFNRVLGINPDHVIALANCGVILTEFKQSQAAIQMFERLIAIDPEYDYALGLLFYERAHLCDWTGIDALRARITRGVLDGKRCIKSLAFMSVSDKAAEHAIAARTFASHYCPKQTLTLSNGTLHRHSKLRVAYVSPDLREHPVGHLMAGIFEAHDKSRFETVAISLGADDRSRLRARMLKSFDTFIDARDMGSEQIARLMREMEIDIAVDLGGYTSDTRTDVFAYRPAPVQVNFLGYPGTLAVDYFDWIIADRHVIPLSDQRHYSERVAYLPNSYLPTDSSVRIAERTPTRAECGLPDTGFVFCSFSHDYKISPPMFGSWMRLLDAVPGSVLWLMSRGEATRGHLRGQAAASGIDPARLVFAERVPLVEDHLARYAQADLFLDTHPYNAHTTGADALMAGLPVLTFMGQSFPSRVGGSLLHAIGVPELITHSIEDYEAMAIELARDRIKLAGYRERIRANRQTHPLFDTARFCRDLEDLYVSMTGGAR